MQSIKSTASLTAIFILTIASSVTCMAQKEKDVYVDKSGVMRWGDSRKEVYGFGINYTAPFAHAYRTAGKLNVDLEKAIEQDVYHFARLGFDAFRVHVWDTEISDSLGNLLENEHLRLFDFMLAKMKARGMKMLITPIAFWGNGYPERDEKTPGFSHKYGKDACLVNEDAIKAQENYLAQFLNHVNPYTKTAYKDDPDIVAFEISNEPHHKGTPEEVKRYINRMSASLKKTGSTKPIFYNVSHSVHLGQTYFTSDITGGTFQWYPTGLGAGHELRGDFLPNVDRYVTPFDQMKEYKSMAKVVYEFDAADVGRSYIYPAMARSFREAGMQWGTHFAYDPTFMAYANTEYNTHYMNLLYAPQKALSLMIAGEVFHRIPRYKSFGRYPANTSFDGFRVSYEEDLAEYVNETTFLYTNSTKTVPANPSQLKRINGAGTSSVVSYEGKGAYFLDQVAKGIWRLEVYPDAIWIDNIFGRNSIHKKVATIKWNAWPMAISLPDLGENFSIAGLTQQERSAAKGTSFVVRPGVYILSREGVKADIDPQAKLGNIRMNEFGAAEMQSTDVYVVHTPIEQVAAGKPLTVHADVVSGRDVTRVTLSLGSGWGMRTIDMKRKSGYTYEAEIAADQVRQGFLSYYISVATSDGSSITFPSRSAKGPGDWEFSGSPSYTTAVVPAETSSLYLFNAISDNDEVSREWRRGSGVVPTGSGLAAMYVNVPSLALLDEENKNGKPVVDYSLRYNFTPNIKGRKDELKSFRKLVLKARSLEKNFPIQVAFIGKPGTAFGAMVSLNTKDNEYVVDLTTLKPVNMVTLPRPYPTFLPYFFESSTNATFNLGDAETIQISIGPGLDGANPEALKDFQFLLESIRLEK